MKKKLIAALAIAMTMSLIACTACRKAKRSNPNVSVGEDYFPEMTFTIRDTEGNSIDESVFSLHKLTMINFWEPWCGPCVGEIPDLEKLYEDYKDMGFQIIGVYSETAMEGEVDQIIRDSGVTYPILHYSSEFDKFQTGYVPTTIFVDGEGHILTVQGEDSVVGSKTYNDWAKIIEKLL